MPTTTNFGWTTPADTDLVKDGASAIRTLGNVIDTSLIDLKGGTTGQVLSKASNTDLDFSWVAQDDSNAIQNAIVDAKGDLITATAADVPARLGVGTDGQILTADSTTSTGLKWATPAGGGKVLQVVQATSTTATTIATQTRTDTGLSGSITPSSTNSKVLVMISQNFYWYRASTSGQGAGISLLRGATEILNLDGTGTNEATFFRMGLGDGSAITVILPISILYLDSPNTTSSTTYKTQASAQSTANSGSIAAQLQNADSVMILMEIGA